MRINRQILNSPIARSGYFDKIQPRQNFPLYYLAICMYLVFYTPPSRIEGLSGQRIRELQERRTAHHAIDGADKLFTTIQNALTPGGNNHSRSKRCGDRSVI